MREGGERTVWCDAVNGSRSVGPATARDAVEVMIGMVKESASIRLIWAALETRNWLKGGFGDAVHTELCSAGHNLRRLINKVKSVTRDQHTYC